MTKTLLIILLILLAIYRIDAQTIYSDEYVHLSYNISKTKWETKCILPEQEDYTNKRIFVWKIELTATNVSNELVSGRNIPFATLTIEPHLQPRCTSDYIHFPISRFKRLENFPWLDVKLDRNILKPGKSITYHGYYYLYEDQKPEVIRWSFPGYKTKKVKPVEKDEFWGGNAKKKNSNKKYKKKLSDSGNKTSNSSKKDGFGDNIKSNQEKLNENENTNGNQFIGEINSKTKFITIICEDHGNEDGDRVAIYHNERKTYSNIYLTKAPKKYTIELTWGMNRIDFKALNQGDEGSNTAKFKVLNDDGKTIANKEWNILTGFTRTLLITKF